MPWKVEKIGEGEAAKEFAVLQDGAPVWVGEDNIESPVNWEQARKKIGELIAAEKTWKQKHKETDDGFSAFREKFKDIDDPAAYIEAKKQVEKLADKKLIDSGEVDKLKDEIKKVYEEKLTSADQRVKEVQTLLEKITQEKDSEIYKLIVTNKFASSSFIKEKLLLPADITEQVFGKNFKVENGQPTGYYPNGEKIYSKIRPGEFADFEESLAALIDQYSGKEHILKGTQMSGGGTQGSDGGGGKVYRTLADFGTTREKLDYIEKNGQAEYQKIVDASSKIGARN